MESFWSFKTYQYSTRWPYSNDTNTPPDGPIPMIPILHQMALFQWYQYSTKWPYSNEKYILNGKYVRYLCTTEIIVFIIFFKIQFPITIIGLASLFACISYSAADTHC